MALVIDTSYYIFYRYFATARWASQAGVTEREQILAAFERHFHADLKNWQATGAAIYFCLDCPREEIWRNEIFPDYKKNRVTSAAFDTDAFPKIYSILEEQIEGIHICKGERLEADDCAYLIVSELLRAGTIEITVITNDNDYLQMDDRVKIQNMQGEDIRARALKKLNARNAAECLLMKILMGDKSDEIPPVCPGIGPKTAEKLVAMSESDRMAFLAKKAGISLELAAAAVEVNRTIISFEKIPESLRKIDLRKK